MILAEQCFLDCINSPVRHIKGRVELYEGSTLIDTFTAQDNLKSFRVERTGEEGKFFGFGVGQKLIIQLVDKNRTIEISKNHTFEAVFGTGCDYIYTNPLFYVDTVERDENTNELTITAYDALYKTPKFTFKDLNIAAPYTIKEIAISCAALLGLPLKTPEEDVNFEISYADGANFNGSETMREVLNAIAEATQTIYFIDYDWNLAFKHLDKTGAAVSTISKDKYFTLKSENSITLAGIAHITELGDNVEARAVDTGVIQYVRDNPFWDLREDIGDLLLAAANNTAGLTIHPFDVSWRGNYLIEIGDKIDIVGKDDSIITSYVLNDTIAYDGGLKQTTHWSYAATTMETATNPATLGAALNQTFAKVDKANKQIELVVSEVQNNNESVAQLQLNMDEIKASVSESQEQIEEITGEITTLTNKVEASITAEDVNIQITEVLENGVNRVETTTGFTFDADGLTVSKSDSEMTTTITEDGMIVYKNEEAVLIADNEGVKAEDLHATTYLIIGTNSRFEDYGTNRTGCFWIGEVN